MKNIKLCTENNSFIPVLKCVKSSFCGYQTTKNKEVVCIKVHLVANWGLRRRIKLQVISSDIVQTNEHNGELSKARNT